MPPGPSTPSATPEIIVLPPNGTVAKVERALSKLHGAVASDDFRVILSKLPDIIQKTILPALGKILVQVTEVVRQFLDTAVLKSLTNVLNAGADVVGATVDLLPEAAQRVAEAAQRFLAMAADFIAAGAPHILAIVDLLGKIGKALSGSALTETQLEASTVTALKALPA